MFARTANSWRIARRALILVLIAGLWLCSVLATYHFAFEAGYRAEFQQRPTADYAQLYEVGDLLERYTPAQLSARIHGLSPPASWAERGGPGSMTYFDTNQSFVVHHSGTVHDDIEKMLDRLRTQ